MKKLLGLVVFILGMQAAVAQTPADPANAGQITEFETSNSVLNYWGYAEYLPKEFDSNEEYPLVIFLHGLGERGQVSSLGGMKVNGPLRRVQDTLNGHSWGRHFPAIIIAPQAYWGWFSGYEVSTIIDSLLEHYPINENKIYVTGLSAGGSGSVLSLQDIPQRLAAVVPIATVGETNITVDPFIPERLKDLPLWFFHNFGDGPQYNGGARGMSAKTLWDITGSNPLDAYPFESGNQMASNHQTLRYENGIWTTTDGVAAPTEKWAYTVWSSNGHEGWTNAYGNDSMWTWLFEQERTPIDPQTTVNAGVDFQVPEGTTGINLNGIVGITGGNLDSLVWTKVVGDDLISIDLPYQQTTTVSGTFERQFYNGQLHNKTYTFRLSALNSNGHTVKDEVNVVVIEANENVAPIANAGADTTMFNQSNIELSGGNSSDFDGQVVSYSWVLLSGNSTVVSSGSEVAQVTGMNDAGVYSFELTVADDMGATDADTINVTVIHNNAPNAVAGDNQVIIEGETLYLNGSQSNDDENDPLTFEWSISGTQSGSGDSVLINFTLGDSLAGSPWNDVAGQWNDNLSGAILNGFTDVSGNSSTINLEFLDAWGYFRGDGVPNAGGILPDRVIYGNIADYDGGSNRIRISGLVPNGLYDIETFSSLYSSWTNNEIGVSINGQQQTTVADTNTSRLVQFVDVSADVNGEINLDIATLNDGIIILSALMIIPKVNGVVFSNQNAALTDVTGLTAGAYSVVLTVTDTYGQEGKDTLNVTVTSGGVNNTPDADAGNDTTYVLGDSVGLDGSQSSDPDGDVLTYQWKLLGEQPSEGDSVWINFTIGDTLAASPWNNLALDWNEDLDGAILNGFINTSGDSSDVSLEFLDAWGFVRGDGAQDTNGVFPNQVMYGNIYDGNGGSNRIKISGLEAFGLYDLNLFSSVYSWWQPNEIQFTVNGQQIVVNAAGNISEISQFADITADANGEVEVTVEGLNGGSMILSAIQLHSKGSAVEFSNPDAATTDVSGLGEGLHAFELTVTDPLNLTDRDTVEITINTNSNNAPDAQIVADSVIAEGQTLSLDGSTSSDIDGDALSYEWKIMGASNGLGDSVWINFTIGDTLAASPWNNLALAWNDDLDGTIINSFTNTSGGSSNISLEFLDAWGFVRGDGAQDTNGIFPNQVMYGNIYDGNGNSNRIKISGLEPNSSYDINLFSSLYSWWQVNEVMYEINGQQITINAAGNISELAGFADVIADANGEIEVTISGVNGGAMVLSAIQIHSNINGVSLTTPNNANTDVTGLTQGTYSFELTVTDEHGLSDQETVSVNVTAN